jgi:hypothetical protein
MALQLAYYRLNRTIEDLKAHCTLVDSGPPSLNRTIEGIETRPRLLCYLSGQLFKSHYIELKRYIYAE